MQASILTNLKQKGNSIEKENTEAKVTLARTMNSKGQGQCKMLSLS